jgi:tetratricopeptide (TPR) repeat protein
VAGVLLFYFLNAFYPVHAAASLARDALARGRMHFTVMADAAREDREAAEGGATGKQVARARAIVRRQSEFLHKEVVGRWEQAIREDPDNSWLWTQLATWLGEVWELNRYDRALAERAIRAAQQAERLDPEGKDANQAHYQLRMLFAQAAERSAEQHAQAKNHAEARRYRDGARQEYRLAAEVLARFVPFDPFDPRLRYQLAEAYHRAGEEGAGRRQAAEAVRLDAALTDAGADRAARTLSDSQRENLRAWFAAASPR